MADCWQMRLAQDEAELDLLADMLLLNEPRTGIWLTIAIAVSDVVHTTCYVAAIDQWLAPFYLARIGFPVVSLIPLDAKDKRTCNNVLLFSAYPSGRSGESPCAG
ncbi:hypothetical protein [Paraburkholderia dilworthii]|uniref:hypothetical protein n=1 Tax=Paraburkholderia dilworthii TaxID=948106 RepID=UPI000561CABE|nr:hypothetical protein [Paraburkholderia dilworthii]